MIKAVVDTNVFLAGLLNASGAPAKLILRWLLGQFDLVISDQVVEEYTYVLRNQDGVEQDKVTNLLEELNSSAISVKIDGTLKACKDPDDNKFLETASQGQAGYLVTKNTKHFPKKAYQSIRIVKLSTFLKAVEKEFPAKP
jgi:putative PIN family toxin of toxin-antitoxin system